MSKSTLSCNQRVLDVIRIDLKLASTLRLKLASVAPQVKIELTPEEVRANKEALAERLREAQAERERRHFEQTDDSEDDDEFLEHVVAIEYVSMMMLLLLMR